MKYIWFLIAFILSAFVAGLINPYVPNLGNSMLQSLVGYAIPAMLLLVIWEKFFRKQGGE
jgi:membrane protein implicated in regulation of membrane protease activity